MIETDQHPESPVPPFDFDRFVALPRLSSLHLSPDGRHLVVAVSLPHSDGKKMASTLWRVDPAGFEPPRRLTRSAKGESNGVFLPDGSLLFTSSRPDPDAKEDPREDDAPPALWVLPAGGGEARLLLAPKGGVDAIRVARHGGGIALATELFPGVHDLGADAEREKARKDAGVQALLFESYPIRHWDHYLGPRQRHVLAAALPGPGAGSAAGSAEAGSAEAEPALGEPRDLIPDVEQRFEEMGFDLTPDGRTVVVAVQSLEDLTHPVADLVAVDVATGDRRTLTPGDAWYDAPACSPDGRLIACTRESIGNPETAAATTLQLVDLDGGGVRPLAPGLDLWPLEPTWSADGRAVFFLADRRGTTAAFRVDVASGVVTCLTSGGTISDLCPSPDGDSVFALQSSLATPPQVVRFDSRRPEQEPEVLPSPAVAGDAVGMPGVVERIVTAADDGAEVGAWLVRPREASAAGPAPLVVFVHGGPLGSWTDGWHWRWNPQVLAARGYAVLLPDPAYSTGYGQEFIQRGWGRWGREPFTDVMAAVDAAVARPDIDSDRTALMGGSFGGYMANWVAGHTDRFRAIITHASLWELRGFHGTTDGAHGWEPEFGSPYEDPGRYVENSPSEHIGSIRTPMLVIHGEQDHRVPISEGLRLWVDLRRHGAEAKFLYYPDENHWILKPQNARLWYGTVLAFLDHHVLGRPWERPGLL